MFAILFFFQPRTKARMITNTEIMASNSNRTFTVFTNSLTGPGVTITHQKKPTTIIIYPTSKYSRFTGNTVTNFYQLSPFFRQPFLGPMFTHTQLDFTSCSDVFVKRKNNSFEGIRTFSHHHHHPLPPPGGASIFGRRLLTDKNCLQIFVIV